MSLRQIFPALVFSDAPSHDAFQYTFANVAKVMGDFVRATRFEEVRDIYL